MGKERTCVMMGINRYQNMIDAMNLMKIISFGENDLRDGSVFSHEEVKKELDAILAE